MPDAVYVEPTPLERLTLWRQQAYLCDRDGFADLARICLGYVEELERQYPELVALLEGES